MLKTEGIWYQMRRGVALANRNWQLLVLQIGMAVAIFIAAMVFVALPMGALLVAMGLDAGASGSGLREALLGKAADPVGYATRSVAAFLLMAVSAGVFAVFALGLSSFMLGGAAGVFWRSASSGQRFRMEYFLSEGRRLFWGILWFTVTATAIGVLMLIVFAITAGIGVAAYKAAGVAGTRMGVFVSTAGWLTLGACAAFFLFYLYMLVLQGAVIVSYENPGATAALRRAYAFIEEDAGGRRLLLALTAAYLAMEMALGIMGAGIARIPGLGHIVAMPYQIGANLAGIYMGLCVLAGLIAYYNDAVVKPAEDALFDELRDLDGLEAVPAYEAPAESGGLSMTKENPDEQDAPDVSDAAAPGEDSIAPSGTSSAQGPEPEPPQPQREGPR